MKHSVDIKDLARMYEGGMTTRQIGEIVSIPHRTVARYLKKAGLDLRNPGNPVIPQLADKDWLKREYVALGRSTTDIGIELGCSASIVSHRLRNHGIKSRPTGSEKGHERATPESRKKMSLARRGKFIGSANPNWRGGIQLKDPDRNRYPAKMWAKAVKDRDGWACKECGAKDRLHAHHIKKWRDYPSLRYELDNGVTLCHSCHEAAHGRGFKFRWPKHAEKPTSAPALKRA